MDQHKQQGQQKQGQSNPGQQNWNDGNTPNRDQADGSRDQQRMPADQHQGDIPRTDPERGKNKSQGERNRSSEGNASRSSNRSGSGISNRGMERELSEQDELPERGSSDSEGSNL